MLLITLYTVILFFFARRIYYEFILPAHLSQFPWYSRYEAIRTELKKVDGFSSHIETRQMVNDFTRDLTIRDCPEYRNCIQRLGKLMNHNQRKFLPKLAV